MLMKIEHGCTKGINVLRPIECQKKQNTAVLTVLTWLDGEIVVGILFLDEQFIDWFAGLSFL